MTPGDWILFAVVSVLATNHVLIRLPGWQKRAWLFWLVQLLNLSAAGFLLVEGLPGFSGTLSVVNYVLALLFVVRAVQNNNRWGRRGKDGLRSDEADSRKAAIRAALRRGEAAPDPQSPEPGSGPSPGAGD